MEKIFPAVTASRSLDTLTDIIQRACVTLGIYDGPTRLAAVLRFLHAEPGQVMTITGIGTARAMSAVTPAATAAAAITIKTEQTAF